ncbi:hypothetical protein HRI_001895700 [Hibiscus trionum]|uniref:Uncharacterized protein n=1 Tax=Hibiscus trionum TaxID=183268 RepID=A0A9W7LZ39_HIBTR|nr:hypothetical protein HRI_001895700 [Hibiscus trionum]
MGNSVIINLPTSCNYRTAENEGGDCDALKFETYLSDLNQQCQGLGYEASRLNRYNVENTDKLMSLKSRIEEFDQREIQLTREIEQLERKVLTSILQKGFEDDEVEKFEEAKGIEEGEFLKETKLEQEFADLMLEIGKINDKFKDFGIVVEETKKCELGINLDVQQENLSQLVSDKEETTEKLGNAVDNVEWHNVDVYELKKANASDNGEEEEIGDIGAQELCKEIELLEAMLERGSFELLDLKTMMEEMEASKGPEKVVGEMEVKMWELESGLRELRRAIVELKGKELNGWVTRQESKPDWGSIIVSVGVAAVAVAAMVFFGRPRRVKFVAGRGNKHKTG